VVASVTDTSNLGDTSFNIGSYSSGGGAWAGYISNFRIVKGTAVYTANFTPSTSPLTAISGTSLLAAQDAVTVTDASTNNFTITKYGDAKAVEASPFKRVTYPFGGSGYFDGASDYVEIGNNAALNFGTGDFTVEGQYFMTAAAALGTMFNIGTFNSNTGILLRRDYFQIGSSTYTSPVPSMPLNAWSHLVLSRQSGTVRVFIDGVQFSTFSNTTSLSADFTRIGASNHSPSNESLQGYISNFRIVKGSAVYTANFTPPVEPVKAIGGTSLLLNFDNAGVYDSSGSSVAQTMFDTKTSTAVTKFPPDTSTYFDGTGDYLKSPASQSNVFGTGDFTVEAWINVPNTSQIGGIAGLYTGYGWNFQLRQGPIYWGNGDSAIAISALSVSINTWTHVAVCRSGTSLRLFINGTQSGSTVTDSTNYSVVSQLTIGAISTAPIWPFTGYIQDVRITKSARYTTNFTPPSASFPTK
jgi:hypothetical protein